MSNLSDPRLGDLIATDVAAATAGDVVIVGVPTDEGVRRNGGRTGAAQAPDEIRTYLRKLTPYHGASATKTISTIRIFDHGNIRGSSLEAVHSQAKDTIAEYMSRGCFVISLGGGHDVTYPLVAGVAGALKSNLGLINIDAHLDVREKKNGLHHSGSSFRLLVEEGVVDADRFTEFGIQPFAVSDSHVTWVLDRGARIRFLDGIQHLGAETAFKNELPRLGTFYLSFDIDSVRSADAPGSSAPSPIGFSAEEAIAFCFDAATDPSLVAMDIVEVNPLFDVDARTSRLAARMIASALAGYAGRT